MQKHANTARALSPKLPIHTKLPSSAPNRRRQVRGPSHETLPESCQLMSLRLLLNLSDTSTAAPAAMPHGTIVWKLGLHTQLQTWHGLTRHLKPEETELAALQLSVQEREVQRTHAMLGYTVHVHTKKTDSDKHVDFHMYHLLAPYLVGQFSNVHSTVPASIIMLATQPVPCTCARCSGSEGVVVEGVCGGWGSTLRKPEPEPKFCKPKILHLQPSALWLSSVNSETHPTCPSRQPEL